MPIYEYQGQQYEIETDDPQLAKSKILKYLESGKPRESAKPAPVEGEGGAAFGMYPQAGRRPESQQDREAALDMPLQTVRGAVSNIPAIAGIPGSAMNFIANLPRTGQDISNRFQIAREAFTGQPAQPQPLPERQEVSPYDMSYFANLTPGPQPSSPAGQLAFGAGQAMGAPMVAPVAKAGMEVAKAPVNFGRGFARGIAYPEGTGANTALAPIRPTYVPHEQVKQFMAGERPASTLTEVPTAPLYENKPVANWAYGMAPENQAGQKLVPYAGRTMEGIGEQIGSQYRQNPLAGVVDIGATLMTGVPAPLTAAYRAVPALAAQRLQKATQFEPGFGPARAAALQREGQMGVQAGMPPTQNILPAPGPVAPTMFASQTGQVTGPQGRPLPTQASGQPVTQPMTQPTVNPKQFSQQVAASKLQQNMPQQPARGPVAPQPMARPQVQPQPQPQIQPTGLRDSKSIRKELNMLSNQMDELHSRGLEEGIKYGTPEGESHQAQLGQLSARTKVLEKELEQALKAEKTGKKK